MKRSDYFTYQFYFVKKNKSDAWRLPNSTSVHPTRALAQQCPKQGIFNFVGHLWSPLWYGTPSI